MNVAIAGGGIAGGYLAALLGQKGITPDVYDGMDHATRCGCRSCGWGVPRGIAPYLADAGLDFNDYLLEPMSPMAFDGLVTTTSLCTIDKPRLLRDFRQHGVVKRQNLTLEAAGDYDMVVDATGITRALLPPCRSDLAMQTLQRRIAVKAPGNEHPEAGVRGYWNPGFGYRWIFPLGNNHYHTGICGIGPVPLASLPDRLCEDVFGRFSFTTLCTCHGFIRVASPYYSTPLWFRRPRKDGTAQVIVGVGESVGTVSPFTGEGIVHSLACARMLADSWPDPERYTRTVLARFAWMKKERETLDYLLSREGTGRLRLRDRWRFFCNARRSGVRLPLPEAFRQVGTLSPRAGGPGRNV